MAAHIIDAKVDLIGLDRWSSHLIGNGEAKTRVIVTYHPYEKSKTSKGLTGFEDHEKYFEPKDNF